MERRALLKMIVAATGTAFVGGHVFAYDQPPAAELSKTGFDQQDVAFLNEVGEAIIPKTDTPGAKQANVGHTMAVIVGDCYSIEQQNTFKAGIEALKAQAQVSYQQDFMALTAEQRTALLTEIDQQANAYNQQRDAEESSQPHYFSMMKQLVLFSFFTSEIGATKVLRHVPIPGSYNGELPYQKGDRAWAR